MLRSSLTDSKLIERQQTDDLRSTDELRRKKKKTSHTLSTEEVESVRSPEPQWQFLQGCMRDLMRILANICPTA